MTIANQIQTACLINGLRAYETAHDMAVNISYADNTDDLRFSDGSSIRVEITEDHEIYMNEI